MHTFEKQQCNSQCTSLDFKEGEILKTIRALNIHKAPGRYDTSIRMIKICDKSLLYKTQIYGKGLILYLFIKRNVEN